MTFSAENLTIVMQGSVVDNIGIDKAVINNIRKVRKHFPSSRIIISTWKMEALLEAQFIKVAGYLGLSYIFNVDPGITSKTENGIKYVSNINRMIFSSFAGVNACETPYVIKMRTDSYLTSDRILTLLEEHICNDPFSRDPNYKVFSRRILNCNLFARNARGYLPYLFHPGDILFCGYKEDVLSLFDIKMADTSIFKTSRSCCFYSIMNYVPEQYIWVKCIENKKQTLVFHGNGSDRKGLISESEQYYLNNFIPFSADQLSFHWPKHRTHYHNKGRYSIYDYSDWVRLYNKYNSRLHSPIAGEYLVKMMVNYLMTGYFFVRTNLLRIPFLKKMALKIFNKRG